MERGCLCVAMFWKCGLERNARGGCHVVPSGGRVLVGVGVSPCLNVRHKHRCNAV